MRDARQDAWWTPPSNAGLGTWHPRGRKLIGPVTFVHRMDGMPTGLCFTVSRRRYWQITFLVRMREWPVIGRVARALYARVIVRYEWRSLGKHPVA